NAENFAGHSDWRLPPEGKCDFCWAPGSPALSSCSPHQLETILLAPFACSPSPCIDPIFGPPASGRYWSASTPATYPVSAWDVSFADGYVNYEIKHYGLFVRAVR